MAQLHNFSDSIESAQKYDFSKIPIQEFDALRMRLTQLTHSLSKIREDMSKADLPQWHSLQAQLTVTLTQLSSLTSTLHHFEELFDSVVPYPLPNFPTTAHEGLLTILLRKKHIPEVETWIKGAIGNSGVDINAENEDISQQIERDNDITKWALKVIDEQYEKNFSRDFAGSGPNPNALKDLRSMIGRSSESKMKQLPPFSIDSVLKYVYQGASLESPPVTE